MKGWGVQCQLNGGCQLLHGVGRESGGPPDVQYRGVTVRHFMAGIRRDPPPREV